MEKPYVPFYKPYGMSDEEYQYEVEMAQEKLAEWEQEQQESIPVELPVMLIFNEHFRWYKEDGNYFIEHPKWSLVGMGENLQDAHRSLLEEIIITKEHFIDIPDEELTEEAKRMKYWLSVIKVKNSA